MSKPFTELENTLVEKYNLAKQEDTHKDFVLERFLDMAKYIDLLEKRIEHLENN